MPTQSGFPNYPDSGSAPPSGMPSALPGYTPQVPAWFNYGQYQGMPMALPGAQQHGSGLSYGDSTNVYGNTGPSGMPNALPGAQQNVQDAPPQQNGDTTAGVVSQGGNLIKQLMGKGNMFGSLPAGLDWLGPAAMAGQGLYGMIQNKGPISNLLSGAETGAGIGSFVPGIGTLIGAGVGALAGGVEDLFQIGKPSQQELEGQQANADINKSLTSGATSQEQQEAAKAGWKNPNDALALIMTRDNFIKQGMPPDQAVARSNQLVGQMNSAQKQGGQAVQQAYSPIQQLMSTRYTG